LPLCGSNNKERNGYGHQTHDSDPREVLETKFATWRRKDPRGGAQKKEKPAQDAHQRGGLVLRSGKRNLS
jgi:hypothetical protein